MLRSLRYLVCITMLSGCLPPDASTTATQDVQLAGTSGIVTLNYPMSVLPLSDRARVATVMTLHNFTAPAAQRACSPDEIEFVELKIILARVDYEEWRTSPWSARQRAEVSKLRKRFAELGAASRTLSQSCQAYSSRLGLQF